MALERTKLMTLVEMPGPPGLPLVGNLHQLDFDSFHRCLESWSDQYGSIYRFKVGPREMVVTSDAETIKRCCRERPDLFRRSQVLANVVAEMRSDGLFTAEGDDWRRQRKLVVTALNASHLKPFFPKLKIIMARLLARWDRAAAAGTPVDLCRDLMRFTVDVTTQLAFGIDGNTVETDGAIIQQQLDKVLPMVFSRMNAPFPYWRYLRLSKDRVLDRALADIKIKVDAMIAETRQRMQADASLYQNPTNFLEAIIAAKESEGLELSDADIFGNVFTLLLAGEDTTANTIAWAINYFIEYPAHFLRARAEVDSILGDARLPEELEQAAKMPFIEAFYNETMRLKPVAPLNGAEPLEDTEILGYQIPQGTLVWFLARKIGMDDANFGQSARFDPERWLRTEAARGCPHDVTAFMPFGSGPRFCPGRNLALLEIRTVLAMFCRNFEVTLADPQRPVEELMAFTMMPKNLLVRLRKRQAGGGLTEAAHRP